MIRLFALDVKEMPDPLVCPELFDRLSGKRKEKIGRCRIEKGRKEIAGAGLLLKKILDDYDLTEDELSYGSNEKPECDRVCFNLSHSDELVLCAVSEKPVGCDVERQGTGYDKMISRVFADAEKMLWESFTEKERDDFFVRLWTIKESYIKMTGEGLKVALTSLDVAFEQNIILKRDGESADCFIKEYEISGFKAAVCGLEDEFADAIEYVKYDEL